MRNSESAHLFTYNDFLEISLYLNYKCGFYSSISSIQSGQTSKQQLSFNNIDILTLCKRGPQITSNLGHRTSDPQNTGVPKSLAI